MAKQTGRENVAGSAPDGGWSRRRWLGATALTVHATGAQTHSQARAIRVLLVTGGHDHEPSFYSIFERMQGVVANVDPHPGAYRADFTMRYDVLALYDLVQLDQIDEARRRNLQKFVESGKGLVVLHHGLCSYNQWEWWWRDVTGVRYLQQPEANQPASTYKHDENLTITPVRPHPVLTGIDVMHMTDETYKGMWISRSNTVLLRTDNATSDGPVAWISAYEKSRVVVIQPGHGREAHMHAGYNRLVRNATFWAARRPV
jgi:type 1 glutamine amidotransferase